MAGSFELEVFCRDGSYSVAIAEESADALIRNQCDVVLADRIFRSKLSGLGVPVVYVDPKEANKTLSYAERVVLDCFEAGLRRGSHLVAVGGGVIQDLATLVASIYMRGIPWSYVPTTLTAMADSCLGGKSSINAGSVKNLIGNIYPPRSIAVDPSFLATLSEADVVAGLSEAVKICFCRGPGYFDAYLELFQSFTSDPGCAPALLHHVLSAKKWFVEIDEFDKSERRHLNFGHTFGHALESATSFTVNHGVGVALGMLCAVTLGEARGVAVEHTRRLTDHSRALLSQVPGLDKALARVDLQAFERAFRADKKHGGGHFRVILPCRSGGVEEVALTAGEDEMKAVRQALLDTLARVRTSG